MIKKVFLILSIFLIGCSGYNSRPYMAVTYVANAGFLVEFNDKKILIDALFGNFDSDWCYVPPDSVVNLMVQAQPPFDDVDVTAVTHAHVDHFNVDITLDHLLHNQRGILVCPAQVAEKLAASNHYDQLQDRIRIISIPHDSVITMTIAGVQIKAIRTRHLPYYEDDPVTGESFDRHRDVEHLEYVFSVDGKVIYHCGDGIMNDIRKYEAYGFGKETIDLAFVGRWDVSERLSFRQTLVKDIIRPERVILMHLSPSHEPVRNSGLEREIAKEVIVPEYPLQRWEFWSDER